MTYDFSNLNKLLITAELPRLISITIELSDDAFEVYNFYVSRTKLKTDVPGSINHKKIVQ